MVWNSVRKQWECKVELDGLPGTSMIQSTRHRPALVLSALPRRILAFPLSYASAITTGTYIPLIVVATALFLVLFVFLAIKLVYMEQRRVGTIHSPPAAPFRASAGDRGKRANRQSRGFLVGLLGSPTWETHLTTWRPRRRRGYQLHTGSTRSGSRLTESTLLTRCSGDADHLLASSVSYRIPLQSRGSSSSKVSGHASTDYYHLRYGDFGEFRGMRSPGGGLHAQSTRRASPSSIRLVNGPSHSNHVEYTFLSRLPPRAVLSSPLMGTRDSIQLSRRFVKRHRKPAPPLPSMPLFLPFQLPNTLDSRPQTEYLPTLRFSPLASAANVFHSQQQQALEERAANSGGIPRLVTSSGTAHTGDDGPWTVEETPASRPRKANAKSNHARPQSRRGLAITGPLPGTALLDGALSGHTDVSHTLSVSSQDDSVTSRKPLKSCLRQNSAVPTPSETCTQTSTSDQASLRTPISDVDIGVLGLDRFRWNEDDIKELNVRSCHMKKDSVALVPVWE